jgi:hypothetical protein
MPISIRYFSKRFYFWEKKNDREKPLIGGAVLTGDLSTPVSTAGDDPRSRIGALARVPHALKSTAEMDPH